MHFLKLSLSKVCLLTLYFITPITTQRVLEVKKVLPAAKAEPANDSNQKDSPSPGPALSLKLVAPSQSPQAPAPSPAAQSSAGSTPTPAPSSNSQPENNEGDKDNKPNNPSNENPPANVVVTTIFKSFTNLPANPADPNPAPTPAPAPGPPPSGAPNTGNPPPPNNGGPNSTDYKNPNGNTAASTAENGDSGFNTILYTGIGVGVVVLAALVSIFILRKWKFNPSERFKTKLTPDIYTQRTYESDHQFLRDLHSS
ncbi:hypothetical protein CONCODRAFT_11984 [Conidiobolus coronatus NRRL 28638]|uniref:Mid2 domain-containing protein n=1 Tax=Conidiobolus coronatus (strain ATCC 28846 / CBS 209.66 / NRRL 28638) TaxID=796925 RepID=A0A137NTX3_CONC2|nr:hypothetical protein CONCODRAFT_11984 [Conidiobolus coronatus NRRL 28638]|eukprot:KXN66227.1 hypothetical protein CONCODRAFT_11984 [Conidiobolus coronatus NRRL 28638]